MKTEIKRLIIVLAGAGLFALAVLLNPNSYETEHTYSANNSNSPKALDILEQLAVKGRAPKTGYSRDQFGNGWGTLEGCDLRNVILARDLQEVILYQLQPGEDRKKACYVLSGVLNDPYTGTRIEFARGVNSSAVQIDHVVALSNAWQTGAQAFTAEQRQALANDPLNLLAVDGPANQQKSDADAATWLPPNKSFRCTYVARQISVKYRYQLWVTESEKTAMQDVLRSCPDEPILE
jgi:hypothetical protein